MSQPKECSSPTPRSRTAFIAWLLSFDAVDDYELKSYIAFNQDTGLYMEPQVQRAWAAWQAAESQPGPTTQPKELQPPTTRHGELIERVRDIASMLNLGNIAINPEDTDPQAAVLYEAATLLEKLSASSETRTNAAPRVPATATSGTEGEIATAKSIAEVASQRPVDTPAVAAPLSARNAIPDVLFDSYAVYKELRSPDASGLSLPAAAVAEVLDAAVRLIRRSDGEDHCKHDWAYDHGVAAEGDDGSGYECQKCGERRTKLW